MVTVILLVAITILLASTISAFLFKNQGEEWNLSANCTQTLWNDSADGAGW